MTSKPRTKVRLVKCPKCSKILPEPEQVPLYTCGGCGTILQAKYYKPKHRDSGLDSHEQDAAQSNGIAPVHDGVESSSSSQRSSSAGAQSSDQNQVHDHDIAGDHKFEQLGGANFKHFTLSSSEPGPLENEGDGEVHSKSHMPDSKDYVMNQNGHRAASSANEAAVIEGFTIVENKEQHDSIAVVNHNEKPIAHANSSTETSRLCGSPVLDSNDLLTLGQDHAAHENKEAQQIARVNGVTVEEHERIEDTHAIPSDNQKEVGDVSSLREASDLNDSPIIGTKETVNNGSENKILAESREYLEGELSYKRIPAEDVDHHDLEAIPNLAKEESNGMAHDDSIDCIQEQLGNIKLSEAFMLIELTQGRNEASTAGREANSGALTDTRKMGSCNVSPDPQYGANSLKTVAETLRQKFEDFDDGSINGSELARYVQKPKALEPVSAHSEDGSSYKTVQRSPTKASLAYDGSVSSFDGNDDQGVEQMEQVTVASNNLKNLASRGAYSNVRFQSKANTSSQNLLDEKLKKGMPEEAELVEENAIHSRINRTRPNRVGFMPRVPLYRSSELFYETGSCSSYMHEDLPIHRMHHHPYRYEDSEAWAKNVYAQKQHMDARRFPEPLWRENDFASMYYNCETSGEIYQRSRHPGYVDRRRRAESWSLSGSLPRVHYSGEIFNGSCQMQDPYMNRRPADIRWSAQLPRPTPFWDSYDSRPTSPRQFREPELYPWAHDAASVSDDQRLRDQIMRRLHLREKRQAVKQHCRPLAGGAPFITCYFCFRVLQLPEEFLLSRRKTIIHRVKCGVCSSILEFSLESETGLYPCIPDVSTEGAETNAGRKYSTEIGSGNSRNEEKMEEYHSAGGRSHSRQMKVTWQLPSRRSKSPLHRLMGYSSPQDLFNGHEEGDDVDW